MSLVVQKSAGTMYNNPQSSAQYLTVKERNESKATITNPDPSNLPSLVPSTTSFPSARQD